MKTADVTYMVKNALNYCEQSEEKTLFAQKVVNETEIKLKEYNFKLLHDILPCNMNLYKWKIRHDTSCDICQSPQTIKHLLLECSYVTELWNKLHNRFKGEGHDKVNIMHPNDPQFPKLYACERA